MSNPYPSADATFGPLHVGNTQDDDPQVIDSFLVEVDAPPDPKDLIGPINPLPLVQPEPTTRLITNTYIMDSSWVPFRLLTADAGRVQLRLRVMSTAATPSVTNDFLIVGYDPSFIVPGSGFRMWNGVAADLDEHTGDLWIGPNPNLTASSSLIVTMLAVTKGNAA